MKDATGREVKVGDYVVIGKTGREGAHFGVIVRLGKRATVVSGLKGMYARIARTPDIVLIPRLAIPSEFLDNIYANLKDLSYTPKNEAKAPDPELLVAEDIVRSKE